MIFELRVLTGLSSGTTLPLLNGSTWHIGSSDEADLILIDSGIHSQHCILQDNQDQTWTVTKQQGSVSDFEGNKDDEIIICAGTPFALGEVWLSISTPGAEQALSVSPAEPEQNTEIITEDTNRADKERPDRRDRIWLFSIPVIILIVLISSTFIWRGNPDNPAPQPARQQVSHEDKSPSLNQEEAIEKIRQMIADREMSEKVKAIKKGDSILLTGNLNDTEKDIINRMLDELAQQYQIGSPIKKTLTLKESKPPFQIKQIVSGDLAHIVTQSDDTVFVGDNYKGFILKEIKKDNTAVFITPEKIEVEW